MNKLTASEKSLDYYDLGNGWYLLNIKTKVNGKLSRVDTYVGTEEDGYSHVGHTEGLDEPGVVGGYREYNQMIRTYSEEAHSFSILVLVYNGWEKREARRLLRF